MMVQWYLLIPFGNTVPNPFIADRSDLKGFSEQDLMKGEIITDWNPEAWLQAAKAQNNGTPDDFLSNLHALPILSKRFRNALDSARIGGLQYLPVRVLRIDGDEIAGFAMANILNAIPALDFDKSEVERFPEDDMFPQRRGRVRDVGRTVLKASTLSGFDVIRIPELPPDIYVSDRFQKLFERGGFTGCSFEPVVVA